MACFVRFQRAWTISPLGARWSIAYKAGWTILVPEAHAIMAVALGVGERVPQEFVDRNDGRTIARAAKLRRRP